MGKSALWQASATNSIFSYVNMEGARLRDATLQGAAFLHTRLMLTDLHNANLADVMLKDVDLSQTEGLRIEQLAAAILSEIEHLPPGMSFDEIEMAKGSVVSLRRSARKGERTNNVGDDG